ncbi:MAG: polysaccharide deacetylase family protein [Lentisphaeria bacterium]|nr:polysaccharide deacetylase family protein [Lentisphaeria bacterium]
MKSFLSFFLLVFCMSILAAGEKRGAVAFTFDDYHGPRWLKADAIFKKYNAHATFFIVGGLNREKLDTMKKLQAAGHSIGLHSLRHKDACTPKTGKLYENYFEKEVKLQYDICKKENIRTVSFAYPNNRRNEESDKEMFRHFDYLRAGLGKPGKMLFYPLNSLKKKMVLGGKGIGKYYKTDAEEIKCLLDKAAESNSLIVFFSHDIRPGAPGISMPTELLEEFLAHAVKRNMNIIGFNEIEKLINTGKKK